MLYVTVKINIENSYESWTGTGFFFQFQNNYVYLVSNRHVFQDAETINFKVSKIKNDGNSERDIDSLDHFTIKVNNIYQKIIYHPNPEVDLAILPISHELNFVVDGYRPVYGYLREDLIPRPGEIEQYGEVIKIITSGYPNGYIDEVNNYPITRSGVSATPPYAKFNGKNEFLIDCAVYNGASGSPVFLNEDFSIKNGKVVLGSEAIFLGILYAGYLHTFNTTIELDQIETPINVSAQTPNNLGIIIKSEELLRFKELL